MQTKIENNKSTVSKKTNVQIFKDPGSSTDPDRRGNLPTSQQPCCIVRESLVPHRCQKLELGLFSLWSCLQIPTQKNTEVNSLKSQQINTENLVIQIRCKVSGRMSEITLHFYDRNLTHNVKNFKVNQEKQSRL